MPTTKVLKSRGTITDLIIRRKTEETAFSATARFGKSAEGKKCPSAIPTTIEIMIQWVELTVDFLAGKEEDNLYGLPESRRKVTNVNNIKKNS
jgi:hypothetical protein